MLYPAMYASASALAFATACRAAPLGRTANRRVSRASPHWRRDHCLKIRQGKVEQRDERQLGGEQVLGQVGADVDGGEDLVDLHLRAELQLAPAAERPPDLQQVPVDLLEGGGEPAIERVELRRGGDEAVLHYRAQHR